MAFPGWDSPEFVRSAHETLEGLAILFFAALVVFDVIAHFETPRHRLYERIGLVCFGIAVLAEVIAYPYGKRNDEFSDRQISRLNKEAGDARLKAANAEKSAGEANERASKNEKETERLRNANLLLQADVLRLRKASEPRRLTGDQRRTIVGLLLADQGHTVVVVSRLLDGEGRDFGADFLSAFNESHWNASPILVWTG